MENYVNSLNCKVINSVWIHMVKLIFEQPSCAHIHKHTQFFPLVCTYEHMCTLHTNTLRNCMAPSPHLHGFAWDAVWGLFIHELSLHADFKQTEQFAVLHPDRTRIQGLFLDSPWPASVQNEFSHNQDMQFKIHKNRKAIEMSHENKGPYIYTKDPNVTILSHI